MKVKFMNLEHLKLVLKTNRRRVAIGAGCFLGIVLILWSILSRGHPFKRQPTLKLPPKLEEGKILYAEPGPARISIFAGGPKVEAQLKGEITITAKQIKLLDENRFLFLGQTDFYDRGDGIYLWQDRGKPAKIVSPTDGFLIERFILSPSKNEVVFWETEKDGPFSQTRSRIVKVSLSKSSKTPLFEQLLGDENLYPLFWSKATDRIYFDSYSSNRQGVMRGVFSANSDGREVRAVPGLSKEEYGCLPILSPNQDWVAFTSISPKTKDKIKAPAGFEEFIRSPLLNPNQVKILNLKTGDVRVLKEDLSGKTFYNPTWSADQKKLAFEVKGKGESKEQGVLIINLENGQEKFFEETTLELIGFFEDKILLGRQMFPFGSLGGPVFEYSPIRQGIYLFDPNTQEKEKILTDRAIQILEILK